MRFLFPAMLLSVLLPRSLAGQAGDSAATHVSPVHEMSSRVVAGLKHEITAPSRWTVRTLYPAAGAAAAIVAVSSLDGRLRAFATDHQSETASEVADVFNPLGSSGSFAVIGGYAIAGIAFDQPNARRIAADALTSSVIAGGIVTPALKYVFGRSRPREQEPVYTFRPFSGKVSFPSGHATQAFAVASVIATESQATWVRVAAWGLAGSVGAARIYKGAHYLSDVTAGALIGTAVGRSVAGRDASSRISIRPSVQGIEIHVQTGNQP